LQNRNATALYTYVSTLLSGPYQVTETIETSSRLTDLGLDSLSLAQLREAKGAAVPR
jgi:acyl carrier protein